MPLVMTMDVRNVNIAVVDLDHSTTSNRIISHIEASEYLSLVGTTEQYIVAMEALENGTVDIIVQIPNNFERDMIVERTSEGKEIKREKGELKEGREKIDTPDFQKFLKKQKDGKITVNECCKQLGISRRTWYNRVSGVI